MVSLKLRALIPGLVFLAGVAHAALDLAVRRDGFLRSGDSLRIVVQNLGEHACPSTRLLLSDRPFLGGPTGTSSQYRPLRGDDAVWVDQEPAGAHEVRLVIHIGREQEPARSRGQVDLDTAACARGATTVRSRPDLCRE